MKHWTPKTEAEAIHALRIYRSRGVGPKTFKKLVAEASSTEDLLRRFEDNHTMRDGICSYSQARAEYYKGRDYGAQLFIYGHHLYPDSLFPIDDAPAVFWGMGQSYIMNKKCLAIVGSRYASEDGYRIAYTIAREASDAGLAIVSGLARGIDTAAHEGALENMTIAVVANGLDVHYPKENFELQNMIAKNGFVISEMPFGSAPSSQNFPRRNRIIAALSTGVLVAECAERSGTMITAKLALEYGKEVMAIPAAPAGVSGLGTNKLIRDGATLVQETADIFDALSLNYPLSNQEESEQEELSINTEDNELKLFSEHKEDLSKTKNAGEEKAVLEWEDVIAMGEDALSNNFFEDTTNFSYEISDEKVEREQALARIRRHAKGIGLNRDVFN